MSLFNKDRSVHATPPRMDDLNELGQAICGVCRKHYKFSELEDKCEFCGRWFCKNCARPVPQGHGYGLICKKCADRITNSN